VNIKGLNELGTIKTTFTLHLHEMNGHRSGIDGNDHIKLSNFDEEKRFPHSNRRRQSNRAMVSC
jgi:hypothetical protein